ncbi:odorant receptor 13a-like [Bicyclus anynana]|uniref:Odorant receptor 13a-like n=1 Tax=Bicyclus anynana TaxID=110368 RepID=A0ABM3LUA9_BICAN|nr:odorant receptor 13a-like [Bicyclus anynana]
MDDILLIPSKNFEEGLQRLEEVLQLLKQDLLQKNVAWSWNNDAQQAFEKVKELLTVRPILALCDPKADVELHTDACKVGLAGIPFKIYTDCNALRTTLTKRDLIPRISRWWIQLQEYDCTIEYRPGTRMMHADALSRNPINNTVSEEHVLDVLAIEKSNYDWISTVPSADDPSIEKPTDIGERALPAKHSKTSLNHTTFATPRANGQVERFNRTILDALATCSHGEYEKFWDDDVEDIQMNMNIPDFEDFFNIIKYNFWFIGIPFDKREIKLRYFILLIIITTTVSQEAAFFFSNISAENFLKLTQLAPCTCIGILSILKIIFTAFKKQNIFNLCRFLNQLYSKMLDDPSKREIVRRDFAFLKIFVKYFFILNLVPICIYNFSTLIFMFYYYYTKNVIVYSLPYALLCPFPTDVWYTWIFVYIQSISAGFICVLYFTTVDALYYALTSHICAQFVLLSEEIQCLDENSSHSLVEIVKQHQYVLKLSQDLEEIFRGSNLVNVLIGSIEICALGFNLAVGQLAQIPGVLLLLLSILIQLLMVSVFGENLIRESAKIGDAAFQCKWYDMDAVAKKSIYFLILRSNKPQQLTAYKFSVISYQNFAKIISTSWSYFTILRTMYSPENNVV